MYEKEEFITRIENQIRVEEEYAQILEDGRHRLVRSKYLTLIPLAVLVVTAVVSLLRSLNPGQILMIWIEGSFYLYMFYFFLMMIPSVGSDAKINIFDKKFQIYLKEFLRLANILRTVRKNRLTLVEFFWNAFLINTKPLVKGFTILYLIDLLCAVVMKFFGMIDWMMFFLLVVQIGVILIFYSRITAAKPGMPGFFVGKPLSENDVFTPEGLKAWLYVGIFCLFTCLIIVGAMFFPGMTLGQFLSDISLVPGEYPLLLALILITQGLILRYFQGVESRKLMNTLNEHHLSVLREDLLPRVSVSEPGDLPKLKREFLLFIMNKLLVQEFFYRFPAYVLMPNLLLALDPVAQEILTETGEEKHLKDML